MPPTDPTPSAPPLNTETPPAAAPTSQAPATASIVTDWKGVHLWQFQFVRDVLLLGAIFGVLWLGYKISIVTVPMLLALMLAYLFEPVVCRITRSGRITRPTVALGIIILSVVVIIVPATVGVGFGVVQGWKLVRTTAINADAVLASVAKPESDALRDAIPSSGWRSIRDSITRNESLREAITNLPLVRGKQPRPTPDADEDDTTTPTPTPDDSVLVVEPPPTPLANPDTPTSPAEETTQPGSVRAGVMEWLRENAQAIGQRLGVAATGFVGGALTMVGSTFKFFFTLFLTAFFFFFFSTGFGQLLGFWERLIPERRRSRVFYLIGRMDTVVSGFVRGRITVAAVLIVVYTVGYWLIGVPAPLIVGPIMGVLTIVPYASTVAAPVAMLLMWLDPAGSGWQAQWWWILGGPLLMLGITQFLDDWILTPLIQGKTTQMDIPTVLFASIAGGALAGIYGVLLAIPIAACIRILMLEVVMPRIRAWAEGRASDPLPISDAVMPPAAVVVTPAAATTADTPTTIDKPTGNPGTSP